MGANLIFQNGVYQLIGASLAILNGIGHGPNEKPYENALAVEFAHLGISFEQQKHFPVVWREVRVGDYIPDLIAFGEIIVDAKTIDEVTDHERGQMINYLRITGITTWPHYQFQKTNLGMGKNRPHKMSSHFPKKN